MNVKNNLDIDYVSLPISTDSNNLKSNQSQTSKNKKLNLDLSYIFNLISELF